MKIIFVSIVLRPNYNMDEKEQRILVGATELFFRYGIKSITMDDIAKHLGMSKKTIYQFYPDKDAIVNQITINALERNKCEFCDIEKQHKNAIEKIFEMMRHMESMFSTMNVNLFYDMQKYHPKSWKLFLSFREDFMLKSVEENLEQGIKEGLYRTDINIPVLARLRVAEMDWAFDPENYISPVMQVQGFSKVHVALLDHFLHGIATLKGHKLINKHKQLNEEE